MGWLVLALVVALAFWNGANDNFKGVASLYGSGVASYRASLWWATATTLAGSLLSFVLAAGLIATFSGKGLVPDTLVESPEFLAAVALGAALTIFIATRLGLPVSTTHALTGALVGAGLLGAHGNVSFGVLTGAFLVPLAIGPLVAGLAAAALYPVATMAGRRFGAARDRCVCVGGELVAGASASGAVSVASQLSVTTGTAEQCEARYQGLAVGVSTRRGVDLAHFASAGAVSFARGVNDTPKMVALILAAAAAGSSVSIPVLGVAIALGGLLAARRVASTMGRRITALSPEHGLIANLVSAGLVIGASRYALPVSTTHVTSGGLFGVGAASRQAGWRTIVTIVVAWLTTLPLAAALAGISYLALTA